MKKLLRRNIVNDELMMLYGQDLSGVRLMAIIYTLFLLISRPDFSLIVVYRFITLSGNGKLT